MKKGEVLSVRIPADQLVVLRGAAKAEHMSLSEYVRLAALGRALGPEPQEES